MKTRAAVLYEMEASQPYKESKPLKIESLELEDPHEHEVLLKIHAAGLCHSDLSVINGSRPRSLPMVLGHEATGEVLKVVYHHLGVSGFAEHAVVSENSIVKISDEIPFERAAVFGCAVITGIGAVMNTAQIRPGSNVAVVGLGGIGLNAIIGAKLAGANEIIALDINEDKFDLAKQFGATATFNSSDDDIDEQIKEYVPGGVEYAFETAGVVPAMQVAYKITKRGGTTVTTGLPHPKDEFSFPQVTLAAEERTVKGSYVGSCVPDRDIPRFISLYKQGRLNIDPLISEVITLDDINEGFDKLAGGDVGRIIVKMH